MRRLYATAPSSSSAVFAYSEHEASVLSDWLDRQGHPSPVEFVPFGVDTDRFLPSTEPPTEDVVSVGADPHRDYELLLRSSAAGPRPRFGS